MQFAVAPNQLAKERIAAGIAEASELALRAGIEPALYEHIEAGRLLPTGEQLARLRAALRDIPAERLYAADMLQIMGVTSYAAAVPTPGAVMEWVRGPMKLFVARDEVTWMQSREVPDRPVDAFLSLSCGTQAMPHLLLDAVAVAKALDIKFVAAAGPAGCCGKPYLGKGKQVAGEAFSLGKIRYAQKIGATTTVTWCHACMQTAVNAAARRQILDRKEHPVREMWIGNFIAERLEELGDRAPWKRPISRRVLMDTHAAVMSRPGRPETQGAAIRHGVFTEATDGMARLLSLIPGVEIVGELCGELADIRPCAGTSAQGGAAARPGWRPSDDRDEAAAKAARLGELFSALGADTVSSTHFGCHQRWSRYASDRMAVRHAVSILAEALDCAHPDRAQAAAHLGDPVEVVRQTRPIWESWDLSEEQALDLATNSIYPTTGGPMGCTCDAHGADDVIPIDVLTGASPGLVPVPFHPN